MKGEIVNVRAFNFFLKLVYRSTLVAHPEASNVPFLLVGSTRWSRAQQEDITQYAFEEMGVGAFTILSAALGAIYAHGGLSTAVVVDIGADKTEIVPVVDYSVLSSAVRVIPSGGFLINRGIKKNLPQLTDSQVEALKKSEIFEVLSDEDKRKSFFGTDGLKDSSEEFDVAAIVTSGRTREILEEREKHDEEKVPNSQMENNSFVDDDGQTLTIGKERFKGAEDLISQISQSIKQALLKVIDLSKRQEAWDHIIIIGPTSRITGFVEALNTQLIDDHLIGKDLQNTAAVQSAFQTTSSSVLEFSQVPNSIRLARMPEYFPEWKKMGYSDVHFLGAQIVAKQIFSTGNESMYVSRATYGELGPSALWELAL